MNQRKKKKERKGPRILQTHEGVFYLLLKNNGWRNTVSDKAVIK